MPVEDNILEDTRKEEARYYVRTVHEFNTEIPDQKVYSSFFLDIDFGRNLSPLAGDPEPVIFDLQPSVVKTLFEIGNRFDGLMLTSDPWFVSVLVKL